MDAKAFLEFIIKQIVSLPTHVKVEKTTDERGVLISIFVHKKDMGILIGREGTHASAIKLLGKLMGYKTGEKVAVKIEEPVTRYEEAHDH